MHPESLSRLRNATTIVHAIGAHFNAKQSLVSPNEKGKCYIPQAE